MLTVSTLTAENVVKEPIKPVLTAVLIIGETESRLNKLVVNQASRKHPIRFMLNVVIGNELSVKKKMPITYLKTAPIAPAVPTKK